MYNINGTKLTNTRQNPKSIYVFFAILLAQNSHFMIIFAHKRFNTIMKTIIIAASLAIMSLTAAAQIESTRAPRSLSQTCMNQPNTIQADMPADLSKSKSVNKINGREYYGKIIQTDIDFMSESTATETHSGTIRTLTITSAGAYSIGLRMSGLRIESGCELYLYDKTKTDIIGAITQEAVSPDMKLRTRQVSGDSITVELYIPHGIAQQSFRITAICHDYANVFNTISSLSKATMYGSSCSTEVDINCDAGQAFQDIKHATLLLSIDEGYDTYICTGTLVNNINCDRTPYVLTAAHCICDQDAADGTLAYFNYELPQCGSKSSPKNYSTLSGTTLVATAPLETYTDRSGRTSSTKYPTMDFALLRLNNNIPDSYQPYFAGVSISETDDLSSVITIHHPQGDVKKISIAHYTPYRDTYPEEDKDTHYKSYCHWHIAQWNVGTTEGGSSGASMLNSNKKVVGILSGGYADCYDAVDDYFQMVSIAWDYYSKPENQLKRWLALGTNTTEILPYNPTNIGSDYLPATILGTLNDDSTAVELTWKTATPTAEDTFSEDFDTMESDDDIADVFMANVDMDADNSAWSLTTATESADPDYAPHSGSTCIVSHTAATGSTNDYLTLPKLQILTAQSLTFWAKSIGGQASLTISQNTQPSRYKEITKITATEEWTLYTIPLDSYEGSSIYINISHRTKSGNATAILIDDIAIANPSGEDDSPKISGYEIYCNNELTNTVSDTSTHTFTHNVEREKCYTYYVLNVYDDGSKSDIGNSVTIDLGEITTATSDIVAPKTPLTVYPNPTTGTINITSPIDITATDIEIFDAAGHKVLARKIHNINKGETIEIPLTTLRPGLYILRFLGQSSKIQKL